MLTVALYYLLNKLLLVMGNPIPTCTLLPIALLLPVYFTHVLDRRYAIFKLDTTGKLIATEGRPMMIYAGFVALVMVCCDFSVAVCLVILYPALKHLTNNVIATLIHITACYCIVLDESIGWSLMQLISLIAMTKALEEISSLRLYPKM